MPIVLLTILRLVEFKKAIIIASIGLVDSQRVLFDQT